MLKTDSALFRLRKAVSKSTVLSTGLGIINQMGYEMLKENMIRSFSVLN
jgi:hypothetical protein